MGLGFLPFAFKGRIQLGFGQEFGVFGVELYLRPSGFDHLDLPAFAAFADDDIGLHIGGGLAGGGVAVGRVGIEGGDALQGCLKSGFVELGQGAQQLFLLCRALPLSQMVAHQ